MSICFLRHFGIDKVNMPLFVVFDVDLLVELEVEADWFTEELLEVDELTPVLVFTPLEELVEELDPVWLDALVEELVLLCEDEPLEELVPLCEDVLLEELDPL